MGEVYTYDATHLTLVREGSVELTQSAELGSVGTGRFALDDTAGTQAIIGQKDFSHTESSCSFPLTFRGFISDRAFGRDAGEERKPHVGAGRGIGVQVEDLNAMLGFRLIYASDDMTQAEGGKRPQETIALRGAWLMASPFVSGLFEDNGRCDFPTILMDKADYRYQKPGDVLADMALAAQGYNYHVNDWGSGPELTFRDDNASTADSSTLRISNVLSDASGVTLHPFKDATLTRRPGGVISVLAMSYSKGTSVRTRAATATAFNGQRSDVASNSNIKNSGNAASQADNILFQRSTEEDIIECVLLVTSAQVNLIRAGMRIEAKFSHLANTGGTDYDSFTWFRVLERTVRPIVADGALYEMPLKLSPQEEAAPAPACSDVNESDGTVTIGERYICRYRFTPPEVYGACGPDDAGYFDFNSQGDGVPSNVNDGDPDTYCRVPSGVLGGDMLVVLQSDLGADFECSSYSWSAFPSDVPNVFRYSSSSTGPWTDIAGVYVETNHWTFDTPIIARYWQLGGKIIDSTAGWQGYIQTWEICGVPA